MLDPQLDQISQRLWQMLGESSRRGSNLHRQFLQTRQNGLQDMQTLIALQIGACQPDHNAQPALFNSTQLDEFGTGLISRCFGPDFARYDSLHIPRIPNGDLKMMSRIVEIHGSRYTSFSSGEACEASIVVEYDVPADAWYLRDNASPELPYSLWMETALQPCGFLSAYLDTYALVPHGEFNFRNLDGFAQVGQAVDVRGKTITTRARMLTSVVSNGTVIQKFAFELRCAGRIVFSGESTFGYFSVETMNNQVGLDSGRKVLPWLQAEGKGQSLTAVDTRALRFGGSDSNQYHLASGHLQFLDQVLVAREGGRYGHGYLYASRPVNPADWFYPCHFYQDPVMPGSLGIEAMIEALQAYAMAYRLEGVLQAPRFFLPSITPMVWRYRGQITPRHQQMELEVHISKIEKQPDQVHLLGDASLWVDGLRIYEVKNLAVGILEGK